MTVGEGFAQICALRSHLRPSHEIPKPQSLQKQAKAWNELHPIGTPVMRYKLIHPLREGQATRIRTAAWVMGGHSVMVMVEGVSGGVLLESVVAIDPG